MRNSLAQPLVRILLAIGFVALAAGLRIKPLPSLESTLPRVTFYPAVIAAALLGGLWTGLSATAMACAAVPGRVPEGPPVWICRDCHAGNLGPVSDAEGKVEIEIRDESNGDREPRP